MSKTHTNILRKVLALCLAAGMALYLVPVSARAETGTDTSQAKAAIGSTTYDSLLAAYKAAKPGDTIQALADADLTNFGFIDVSGLTLDLNDHCISAQNYTFGFKGSNFTIKNGTFDSLGGAYGLFIGDNPTSTNVLLQNLTIVGGVNIFNAGGVVLRNVNVDASKSNSPYYAVWCDINAQATIQSGTYKSNGAAVLGLSDSSSGAPASVLNVKGGDFYTDKSPLVLGGDRYKPTISGGSFFDGLQAQQFVDSSHNVVEDGTGRFTVQALEPAPAADPSTPVPDKYEMITTDLPATDKTDVAQAVKRDDVAHAFAKVGGTQHLWNADVILRNTTTLEEKHDAEMTFVLPYPADVDASRYDQYDFVVMHMKANAAHARSTDGRYTPEILPDDKVNAMPTGLQITSTLSPFVIGYSLHNNAKDNDNQNTSTNTNTNNASNTSANTGTTSNTNAGQSGSKQSSDQQIPTPSAVEPTAPAPVEVEADAVMPIQEFVQDASEVVETFHVRMHVGHGHHDAPAAEHVPLPTPLAILAIIGSLIALAAVITGIVLLVRRRKSAK